MDGSVGKVPVTQARDLSSIPGKRLKSQAL